jgi:hypothetical protein
MIIKPNASENEKTSPFYIANEKFCREFENFISEKNGKVNGNYNAWSYTIFGKINNPKNWILKYKKATYSGGNLLLTSKYQNLLTLAEWTTNRISHNSGFLIRKKTRTDFFLFMFSKSLQRLKVSDHYILISKTNNSELITELIKKLTPLFKSGEVYKIENKNDKLTIELRTEKHHFDLFNSISEL